MKRHNSVIPLFQGVMARGPFPFASGLQPPSLSFLKGSRGSTLLQQWTLADIAASHRSRGLYSVPFTNVASASLVGSFRGRADVLYSIKLFPNAFVLLVRAIEQFCEYGMPIWLPALKATDSTLVKNGHLPSGKCIPRQCFCICATLDAIAEQVFSPEMLPTSSWLRILDVHRK
jgi:hypothetical protein